MARIDRTGRKAGTGDAPDGLSPVERLHRTLTGDVADIYIRHVPAFKGLDRERVYDMVMSNHALAAECYRLFESRPELFAHLLVDRAGQPVQGAAAKLFCGLTTEDVTAMLVRAVAKRYFLRRFASESPAPEQPDDQTSDSGGFRSFLPLLFRRPEPDAPEVRRKATRGDSLYRAMRHHLRYSWQLKLIPHYTPLPVSTVRQLGAKILEYRSARDLKQLLREGPPAEAEKQPTLIRVKMPQAKQANSAAEAKALAMWEMAQSLGLARIFSVDEREMRRIVNRAAVASGTVIAALAASGL